MIDRNIIAQNITNLTDARYFAAWGVSYVSFNTIPDSPYHMTADKVQEIKDWLEGPKCLIETNALEFDELADGHILSNVYSSLPMSKECFYRIDMIELKKGLPSGKYIIKPDSETQLAEITAMEGETLQGIDLYIDISDLTISSIDQLGNFGLVVQGGEEEAAGVKSFDDLDELYDLLMD